MDDGQRAVPIRVLTVGKKRSRGVQLLVDEYIEKLKNYCIVEDVQLRSNPRNARYVIVWSMLVCKFCLITLQYLLNESTMLVLIRYFHSAYWYLNFRDPRAQVDDEDMAVVNLLKSDDWVYLSTFFFVGSSHILLLWLCSFTI